MYYKPIEIAKSLNVSTSALRHYETWGIVPTPERAKNGYRLYTEVHFAYFRFIRAMFPAVSMRVISNVLRYIQQKNVDAAFWIINEEQAKLHHEKKMAENTLAILYNPDIMKLDRKKLKNEMTIGEVAELAEVTTSAIRHWEKEGLLVPNRNPDNGYRSFTQTHLSQILLIRAMRSKVHSLENLKEAVKSVEHYTVEQAKKVAKEALESINHRNHSQLHGIYELYDLCKVAGLLLNGYSPLQIIKNGEEAE